MRGDINLWDVGKEYIAEKQAGIENTIKAVGTGIWQLSPFSKVSDEDVYKLGYNLEGALLSASEAVLVTYVGAKLPGIAKSVAGKVSPKLKSISNKIINGVKNTIKSDKTACGKLIGCFTEGTLVATENGYKAIEEIEIGDYVWSENPFTGEIALKQVVDTFVYEKDTLVILEVNGKTIETTKEHPFYVENIGWVSAKYLEVGDVLRLLDGTSVKVDKIEIKELDSIINVYNFEVEDFHTYFVGEDRVLVHNDCTLSPSRIGTGYTKGGMKRATKEWREQYGPATIRKHHLIPQEMLKDKRFVKRMNELGISDVKTYVDRQIAVIQNGPHIDLHVGGWNKDFKGWYKGNENFTLQELRTQTSKMMRDYNIPKSSRNFAKKY